MRVGDIRWGCGVRERWVARVRIGCVRTRFLVKIRWEDDSPGDEDFCSREM